MLYAESSAIVAWLLDEADGPIVGRALAGTDAIIASDLTLIECEGAIRRAARLDPQGRGAIEAARGRLAEAAASWVVERISSAVVDRARQPFPDDTIRSLDAIHLATALVLRMAGADVEILSLDERVRSNGRELGFRVLPA